MDVAGAGEGFAAYEVSAADDDGDLYAGAGDGGDLFGDALEFVGFDAEAGFFTNLPPLPKYPLS